MTPEERAFAEGVRCAAMDLTAKFAACEKNMQDNPRLALAIARRGGLAALALCHQATARIGAADLAADNAEVQAAGYDLAALATAPPSRVKE